MTWTITDRFRSGRSTPQGCCRSTRLLSATDDYCIEPYALYDVTVMLVCSHNVLSVSFFLFLCQAFKCHFEQQELSNSTCLSTELHKHCFAVLNTQCHTQSFNGSLSGTTQVGQYQKKHSLTHTHRDHQTSFINFLRLL